MKTTIEQLEGCTLVTLDGALDTADSVEVKKTLAPLMEHARGTVVLECKDLSYIASSGLRILLSILKSVKTNGGKLTLRNVNDNVKKIFSLTGFVKILDFE